MVDGREVAEEKERRPNKYRTEGEKFGEFNPKTKKHPSFHESIYTYSIVVCIKNIHAGIFCVLE